MWFSPIGNDFFKIFLGYKHPKESASLCLFGLQLQQIMQTIWDKICQPTVFFFHPSWTSSKSFLPKKFFSNQKILDSIQFRPSPSHPEASTTSIHIFHHFVSPLIRGNRAQNVWQNSPSRSIHQSWRFTKPWGGSRMSRTLWLQWCWRFLKITFRY